MRASVEEGEAVRPCVQEEGAAHGLGDLAYDRRVRARASSLASWDLGWVTRGSTTRWKRTGTRKKGTSASIGKENKRNEGKNRLLNMLQSAKAWVRLSYIH